jgi:hypothetical protein
MFIKFSGMLGVFAVYYSYILREERNCMSVSKWTGAFAVRLGCALRCLVFGDALISV